jgi:hypothetical protein
MCVCRWPWFPAKRVTVINTAPLRVQGRGSSLIKSNSSDFVRLLVENSRKRIGFLHSFSLTAPRRHALGAPTRGLPGEGCSSRAPCVSIVLHYKIVVLRVRAVHMFECLC